MILLADDGAGNPGAEVGSRSFDGQPATNLFGEVSFGESDSATLTIDVRGTNDDPAAAADTNFAVEAGGDSNTTRDEGGDGIARTTTSGTSGSVFTSSVTEFALVNPSLELGASGFGGSVVGTLNDLA